MRGPKKIWHHFGLFLSLFSAFHLKFLQLCKKPPSYISGTHQLLFPLVNNGQNWCQKLCKNFSPLLILQGECDTDDGWNVPMRCCDINLNVLVLRVIMCTSVLLGAAAPFNGFISITKPRPRAPPHQHGWIGISTKLLWFRFFDSIKILK